MIREAADILSLAYECFSLMEGSSLQELPYPIVYPLQRWFDTLEIKNKIIFRAELVANYELLEVTSEHFLRIKEQFRSATLNAAIEKIEWPLLRVTVPSKAFSSISHMAIVAHEIGHALYKEIAWTKLGADTTKIKVAIEMLGWVDLTPKPTDYLQKYLTTGMRN